MSNEYTMPDKLTVINNGIQGNSKWALWSDSVDDKVRLWIKSEKEDKGNDKLVITYGGNIGIGIDEPSAKLQVSGDLVLEKTASPLSALENGAARIYNDNKGLHIQCPGDGSSNGTLEVIGDLKVTGSLVADKGLSVKNGLLEAMNGMTVKGTLTATENVAVTVDGETLNVWNGLEVTTGSLEAKNGMTVEGTLTVKKNVAVTVDDGTLNVGNGLNVGTDKFVIGPDGAASFQEKATFKKGIDITGALKISSLNVGEVAAEVQPGNAAVAADLNIGERLILNDNSVSIRIEGSGSKIGSPCSLQIGEEFIYNEKWVGLRLTVFNRFDLRKVSDIVYHTESSVDDMQKLADNLSKLYNFCKLSSYKCICVLASNGAWENKDLHLKLDNILNILELTDLQNYIDKENFTIASYIAIFSIDSSIEIKHSEKLLLNEEKWNISGWIYNGSFLPDKPHLDHKWFWQCANGCAGLSCNSSDNTFTALYIDAKGDSHFYGTIFGKDHKELSDKRLKTCIFPIKNVLTKLEGLQGIFFEWNDPSPSLGLVSGQKDIGILAQDVKEIFPELVSIGHNGYLSMGYSKLTVLLLEAIKELSIRVKTLELLND